jgi:RHS repeat-associated protein
MQLSGNPNQVGVPETDIQSWPYGDQLYSFPDQYAPSTANDSTPLHFTGKERDTESGNDYFGARYYASSMGRFMSPDWSAKTDPVPYAKLDDPQSLNLYAYVMNNPLNRVDPDGHGCNGWGCLQQAQTESEKQLNMQKAQQQNGDPTLPTAVQEPISPLDKALGPTPQNMLMVLTGDLGEIGEAGKALSEAGEAGEALLTRYGTKVESTLEKLAGDAAKAEEKIGIHGVSTTSMPKPTLPGGSAPMSAVQKAFNVFKTAGPGHFTVELPKPVTDAVVQIFNSLFFK